ncbi:MAG: UDP-N-acetylmuramoyl-tripeptide--D-alanyl-D-alanine ligase [Cyanobacteriota bacterium]|nr:UDP-N-acetylmuramoyl-tripeptide--D-alanyl-D-alanine ligase [Cyanobacteriota bacterium]
MWGPPATTVDPGALGFTRVSTDSRLVPQGALFVPLVGERFDGHAFLEAVLTQGLAGGAVAQADRLAPQEATVLAEQTGRPIWRVNDTLEAYQQIGRTWRRQLGRPLVAVTGSAGKTTTRELIRSVLAPLGAVLASSGNENNDVGVPLTLLKADAGTAALVIEMGMRGLGEIDRLSRCAEPDVAVITNIGTAHIGRLGSREAIATAKCEITAALRPDGLLVIPAGDPLLEAALARVWQGRVRRVALSHELEAMATNLPPADRLGRLEGDGHLTWQPPTGPRVQRPLEGVHNARNLMLALAVGEELGVELAQLSNLEVAVPGGRSRRLSIGGVDVLDETYNASPEAVLAALDLLATQGGRRFAVLGTMLELGDRSLELHQAVARRARDLDLDGLVVVDGGAEGAAMLEAATGLPRLVRVATVAAAAQPLLAWLTTGDRLLLKASRGVALEQLIPLLEQGLASSP